MYAPAAILLAAALAAPGGKIKPTLVDFRPDFDKAVKEAVHRNVPLLFIIGKDH